MLCAAVAVKTFVIVLVKTCKILHGAQLCEHASMCIRARMRKFVNFAAHVPKLIQQTTRLLGMADTPDELEDWAARFAGLAGEDAGNDEEVHDFDVARSLRALREESSAASPAIATYPPTATASIAPEAQPSQPTDGRAANAEKARRAKAEKRKRALEEAAGSPPAPAHRGPRGAPPAPSSSLAIVPVAVPRSILTTMAERLSTPFGTPHLQSAMMAAMQGWSASGHIADNTVISMVGELCTVGDGRCETKTALYRRLGIPDKKGDSIWPHRRECVGYH